MIRAFQWDLARQVERLDFLQALLPRYAAWGYEELYLHLEDAVHYPSLPGIARDDAYTYQELGELVLTAAQNGIRVVPIVNLLGHTQYLIKHPDWRDLNELRDERDRPLATGQLCPLHPRTLEVADKLLRDVAPYCTAGKVHVGLDESLHLGKCPRCREEAARLGLGGHFAGHVNRLHTVCGALNLSLGLWADMLYFTPDAIPLLPRGVTAYDWYYYPFAKKPRVEFFNFAERDLQPALQKQGIAYYGCPMNGAFRHEPLPVFGDRLANIRSWWQRCTAVKAAGFLVTAWEPQRLALETTTLVDAAAANLWLEPDADDSTSMLARGLERIFQAKAPRDLARTLLAADAPAFAGYARWQINDRWDTFAGNEGLKPYERERTFFARLGRAKLPGALAASVTFRSYLAERDWFVRQAARDVFKLRRLLSKAARPEAALHLKAMSGAATVFAQALKTGRKAAQAMWRQTRNP
ncbi:MAG: family 20 glycosylhydrolase, partial [bacterium]|nr:family 20 glycosylhydrolase [bacterium]